MEKIAQNLNIVMIEEKHTNVFLGKNCNKSAHTIGRIRNGVYTPPNETILIIARALEIDPFFLAGEIFDIKCESVMDYWYLCSPDSREFLNKNWHYMSKISPVVADALVYFSKMSENTKDSIHTLIKNQSIAVSSCTDHLNISFHSLPNLQETLNSQFNFIFNDFNSSSSSTIETDYTKMKGRQKDFLNNLGEQEVFVRIDGEDKEFNLTKASWISRLKLLKVLDKKVWDILVVLSILQYDTKIYNSTLKLLKNFQEEEVELL